MVLMFLANTINETTGSP
jgi:hypothetical protein